jgi:TDG/mug DNA glycosylase family protein
MTAPRKPTPAEIAAAAGKTVPDVVAPGLKLLFVGINPGLYSAAIGHHFGRPGNRFWPALHRGGVTERVLRPYEEQALLARGCGITNIVARATATADALSDKELRAGAKILTAKVEALRPGVVAFLGLGSYRTALGRPKAQVGRQAETLGGALVWALPNPSGLNAHYSLDDLGRLFAELWQAVTELRP